MEPNAFLFEDITFLSFYLAFAFFILGLWLGWTLWGKNRSSDAIWTAGQSETRIAPLLNPTQYSNVIYVRIANPSEQITTPAKPQAKSEKPSRKKAVTQPKTKKSPAEPKKPVETADSELTRTDPKLGLVYTQAPAIQDDLMAIKGVAKVLNGKLNQLGVYTYKQIANWDETTINEFSKVLSFKNRVQKDDWIGQAKALHQQKYGESI